MNNQPIHLPSLTYDELIQLVIVNLRKCPKCIIIIEKDPMFDDDYELWVNDEYQIGGQIRDVLESLAEYEFSEDDDEAEPSVR